MDQNQQEKNQQEKTPGNQPEAGAAEPIIVNDDVERIAAHEAGKPAHATEPFTIHGKKFEGQPDSPQPAPATGDPANVGYNSQEHEDEPAPATAGEWTVKSISKLINHVVNEAAFQTIADAHNASLDAEREKREHAERTAVTAAKIGDKLKRDLAAAQAALAKWYRGR